jgi:hypothetical protein
MTLARQLWVMFTTNRATPSVTGLGATMAVTGVTSMKGVGEMGTGVAVCVKVGTCVWPAAELVSVWVGLDVRVVVTEALTVTVAVAVTVEETVGVAVCVLVSQMGELVVVMERVAVEVAVTV